MVAVELVGIWDHRPELPDLEGLVVATHPRLAVGDRSTVLQEDRNGDGSQQGKEEQDPESGGANVECSLSPHVLAGEVDAAERHDTEIADSATPEAHQAG